MKNLFAITSFIILFMLMSINVPGQKCSRSSDLPESITNSKPFKRYEWNHQQRAYPYDTIPYRYASKVVAGEVEKIMQESKQARSFTSWNPKGPSFVNVDNLWPAWDTVSGRIKAMAVHPDDHLTVYVGAACGGLWKTIDGGETWMDIGHDLQSMAFGAIAIDPNNPETVYAGAGETLSGIWENIFIGYGMYKSTDGGTTWDTINDFGQYSGFTDIVVSPFNSNVIYASLASGPFNLGYYLPNEGVWKSTNAGGTWEKVLDLPRAFDIILHPNDPDVIYACIGGPDVASGIHISTDQGENWNLISNAGLPAPEIINRIQLDISLTNPDILYAVIHLMTDTIPNHLSSRAYKSMDGGSSWTHISEGVPLGGYSPNDGWYDQGWYDLCITIDPLNSDHVFIGNVELHETTDGQNFSPVRYPGGSNYMKGIAHPDYHQLKYAPSNPAYFYMGCDGGVYLSTDGCNSATSRNVGLNTILFYRMGSHPTDPDIMIAGAQDNGTMMTIDGGNSWKLVNQGDGKECFFDYHDPDIVYSTRGWGRLYKSNDGGQSFGFIKDMNGEWVTPFFIHPTGHDTIYSANNDVYRYPDTTGAPFWKPMTTNLSSVLINTLSQSRINPDHMILAGYNYSYNNPFIVVMISTDGGYNWTDVTGNIDGESKWISRVKTHPWDENTMFVVKCGYSDSNKIYRTTDLGQNWSNVSGNLPDIPCNDVFINPGNSSHYYVGTDLGVYLSEDGGSIYQYAGGGMPLVPIMEFDYSEFGGIPHLRVATHGRGIFETTDLAVGISEVFSHSNLMLTVAPNPCSTSALFTYELQKKGNVVIAIYNQLGSLVELKELYQQRGIQRYEWKPGNHSDGIYYVKLQIGNISTSGKIIVCNN